MLKQYFHQAIYQLKENKLISTVSIVGTALAICMIMVMVIVLQVRMSDCAPEVNRSRSLYVKYMSAHQKDDVNDSSTNGPMSLTTARECFKALTVPEAVAIVSTDEPVRASVQGGKKMSADKQETDEAFWKVFAFDFIAGKPYTQADCASGLPRTVVSATVARKLFGTTDVVGQTMQLNQADYTITGVVKDVSKLATACYAQVWVPFTSTETTALTWYGNTMGTMSVIILAHSAADFPAIRAEAEKLRQKYNEGLGKIEVFYRGQPDTQFASLYRSWGERLELSGIILRYVVVIVILLLVPAINLSSMTLSRMRKRMSEIGVRKAFGATGNELLRQIFMENLILTLLAGVIGLLFSYAATFVLNDFLFSNSRNAIQMGETSLSADMLLNPTVFVATLLFCLLMNLLSAGIPAWKASRMNIMDALNQR